MSIGALRVDGDELALLHRVFPRCDFSDDAALRFLRTGGDVDVQAAPGSGKTTLLVAKLLLLARGWIDPHCGICILSHTNAAREEVEKRLTAHPAGTSILGYPHFIGTVTSFLHRFLARPFLRGKGWPVERVDDDLATALLFSASQGKQTIRAQRWRKQHAVDSWIRGLTLSVDADFEVWPPTELGITAAEPKPHTNTHRELRELKAEVVADGVLSFSDMVSVARRCVLDCPAAPRALATRFPLVFMDETQDSGSFHLALLETIFRGRSSIQRLGDVNQTIYDDGGLGERWAPGPDAIDLGYSRRLGALAADFASKLTPHKPQVIRAGHVNEAKTVLILFDKLTIGQVIPTFARLAVERCGDVLSEEFIAMAVASRHRPGAGSQWPGSLVDYCAEYRAPGTRPDGPEVACRLFSALQAAKSGEPLRNCFRGLKRAASMLVVRAEPVGSPEAGADPIDSAGLRRLFLHSALSGEFACRAGWDKFTAALATALEIDGHRVNRQVPLAFPGNATTRARRAAENFWVCETGGGSLRVGMGSIHSVKGQTHDATLVLDTPVNRVHDVDLAVRCAFGGEKKPASTQTHRFRALTNVFVGATRARRLLCLAMPKNNGKGKRGKAMVAVAKAWDVIDLTTGQPVGDEAPP